MCCQKLFFLPFFFICLNCVGQSASVKYNLKEQKITYKMMGLMVEHSLNTINGQEINISDLKGKYLVTDFWFTHCAPCFREFPFMDRIRELFLKDTSLVFLNICSSSPETEWKEVVKNKKLQGIHLFDPSPSIKSRPLIGTPKATGRGELHDKLYLRGYPGYAFIKDDGTIMGATNLHPSDSVLFAYFIEGLLQNKTIQESTEQFLMEIKNSTQSKAFNSFLKKRFNIDGDEVRKMVEGYRKVL